MNSHHCFRRMGLASLIGCLLTVALITPANAHFVWIFRDQGKIKLVFGEGLEPDQAQFLKGLSGMKVTSVQQGKRSAVSMSKMTDGDLGWFEVPVEEVGNAVDAACEYGVFGRGEKTMFLDYSAKYINLSHESPQKPATDLKLDLVVKPSGGKLITTAYFNGKVAEGLEIDIMPEDGDDIATKTDEHGSFAIQPAKRILIRAKHVVPESGEHNGKKFSERRYYCTLVLDVPTR